VKSQKIKPGKQGSMEGGSERPWLEKTDTGKQRGKGSGNVGAEAGDCEDEKIKWADMKGG
jgi:hypothetical protein